MYTPTPTGLRRRLVTLLSRNTAQDTVGQATGYTAYLTTRAYVETVKASDAFNADAITSEVTHRVNIRFARGITVKSKDRLLVGNPVGTSWPPENGASFSVQELRALAAQGVRVFDIKACINVDERNLELNLMCLELADGTPAGA